MMVETPGLHVEVDARVAVVHLERPDRMNALTPEHTSAAG